MTTGFEKLIIVICEQCQVDCVRQVNRHQMYGMYLLRKEEMETVNRRSGTVVKELVLYHVTTEEKGVKSLNDGLDWRRTKRSRFGRGVSFSDDADYADFYANHSAGEGIHRDSPFTYIIYIYIYSLVRNDLFHTTEKRVIYQNIALFNLLCCL